MPNYNEKMEDSFRTKLKIFLFSKAFDINIEKYIQDNKDNDTINKEFHEFALKQDIAKVYSSQYYQFESEMDIIWEGRKVRSETISNNLLSGNKFIISTKNLRDFLGNKYGELFCEYKKNPPLTEELFNKLINTKKCSYCGIEEEQIWRLLGSNKLLNNKRSETRGYSLEIDRKSPNLEYTKDNCCMSCYWCNNAKTDEFEAHEFKEIAKGINNTWNTRLKNVDVKETIEFPENSTIWNK